MRGNIGTGKRVLDIGCRDGSLTGMYAEGNNVVGLDIDADALRRAQEAFSIETKQVDLNGEWGIEPRTFDRVVAAEVIEHLYYPETVVGKIAQVLKDDGALLGTVPNAFSLKNRLRLFFLNKKYTPLGDPTHINQFVVSELDAVLKKHFKDVTIIGAGRHEWLARTFPQTFAFDLLFIGKQPKR